MARRILQCRDLPRLREGLEAGAEWRKALDVAEQSFVEAAFSAPVVGLRAPLVAGSSFFVRWGSGYRKASNTLASLVRTELPGDAPQRVALVDELLNVASLQKRWDSDMEFCIQSLGEYWRGERTDFGRLLTITLWCERVAAGASDCSVDAALRLAQSPEDLARQYRSLSEQAPLARRAVDDVLNILDIEPEAFSKQETGSSELDDIAYRVERMAQSTDRYVNWAQLSRHHSKLVKAGLPDLALKMRTLALDGAAAATELRYARSERLWKAAIGASPAL
ncbi:MAG: hypothetical protein B7Z20_12765, partial [Sphingobium sp. 32-64-5]